LSPCFSGGFPKLLTGKVDEAGNRLLNVTYDNRGRATSSGHPGDADKIVLSYNSATSQVAMPDGSYRTYVYGNQFLPRLLDYITAGSGQTRSTYRTYDASDRLYEEIDSRSNVVRYAYDSYHETSRIVGLGTSEQQTIET